MVPPSATSSGRRSQHRKSSNDERYIRVNTLHAYKYIERTGSGTTLHPHSWGRRTARPTSYSLAIRQRLPSQGTTRHRASGRSLESRMAIVQAVRLLG